MIDKRVGKRIKQRREQLGLTQEQFAEKLGVATNYISIDGGCFALFFAVFRSICLSCVAVFLRSLHRFQVA